jgi:hypothetical protein
MLFLIINSGEHFAAVIRTPCKSLFLIALVISALWLKKKFFEKKIEV